MSDIIRRLHNHRTSPRELVAHLAEQCEDDTIEGLVVLVVNKDATVAMTYANASPGDLALASVMTAEAAREALQ